MTATVAYGTIKYTDFIASLPFIIYSIYLIRIDCDSLLLIDMKTNMNQQVFNECYQWILLSV